MLCSGALVFSILLKRTGFTVAQIKHNTEQNRLKKELKTEKGMKIIVIDNGENECMCMLSFFIQMVFSYFFHLENHTHTPLTTQHHMLLLWWGTCMFCCKEKSNPTNLSQSNIHLFMYLLLSVIEGRGGSTIYQ